MDDYRPATWVSYSTISDYLHCPRSYFLKNIYKDPSSGRKVALMQPALALGQAVHAVLDELALLPVEERLVLPFTERYQQVWRGVAGKRGGFKSEKEEHDYFERGKQMLEQLWKEPGLLQHKSIRIREEKMLLKGLPSFTLSEEENIVLCGKVDWLEYLADSQSVHIVDFKTGKNEEKKGSLQLPIYLLLVQHCQSWPVKKMSYWYLEAGGGLQEVEIPEEEVAERQVMEVAKDMKWARENRQFPCHQGGCRYCQPYEEIREGKAEYVYTDWQVNKDIYMLPELALAGEGLSLEVVGD